MKKLQLEVLESKPLMSPVWPISITELEKSIIGTFFQYQDLKKTYEMAGW